MAQMIGSWHWWENYDIIVQVGSYLVEKEGMSDVGELLYFFEKPWKWDDSYQAMTKELQAEEQRAWDKADKLF